MSTWTLAGFCDLNLQTFVSIHIQFIKVRYSSPINDMGGTTIEQYTTKNNRQ
jgi:hypothetical protein